MKKFSTRVESLNPELTIAVCTYRRYSLLAESLAAIRNLKRPPGGFVVLVIDNSLQPEEAERFFDSIREMPDVQYHVLDQAGLSHARNHALQNCTTELLAMIDDDSIVEVLWAVNMLAAYRRHGSNVGAIGGQVHPIWTVPRPNWLGDQIMSCMTVIDWGPEDCEVGDRHDRWLVGANVMYNAPAVRMVGGYNEQLGRTAGGMLCHEELDLHLRLSRAGYRIIYTPDAAVHHYIPENRVKKGFLLNLSYSEGISRAIMDKAHGDWKRDLVDSLKRLDIDYFLSPRVLKESSILSDTDDPELFAIKMSAVSRLGYFLQHIKHLSEAPSDSQLALECCIPPVFTRSCGFSDAIYVVMPVRNAAETIAESLDSIIAQNGDFEVCLHVQDGASTDGTVEIVKGYQARLAADPSLIGCRRFELTLESVPDKGLYDAVARGVEFLGVPDDSFMTYLNGDDFMQPGAFAHVLAVARQHPDIHWLCGMSSLINKQGEETLRAQVSYSRYQLVHGLCDSKANSFVQQEGGFWRGWLWRHVGGVDRTLRLAGDYSLWRRFSMIAELFSFDFPLASFRQRPGALSSNMDLYYQEVDAICDPESRNIANFALMDFFRRGGRLTFPVVRHIEETGEYVVVREDVLSFMPWLNLHHQEDDSTVAGCDESSLEPASADPHSAEPEAVLQHDERISMPDSPHDFSPCGSNWKHSSWFRKLRHRLRAYKIIHRSGLFFTSYYTQRYPDVIEVSMNPLWHYITIGDAEGRQPNPLFDPNWYRARYSDVHDRPGINTLWHYIAKGARFGCDPGPEFDTGAYLATRPGVRVKKETPLSHCLRLSQRRRYPKWLVNMVACFIPKRKNRHHFRKKYTK